MSIGRRAVDCIYKRAWETETTVQYQCDLLDMERTNLIAWRRGKANPGARVLAEMHRQGYDVIYILSGEKKL